MDPDGTFAGINVSNTVALQRSQLLTGIIREPAVGLSRCLDALVQEIEDNSLAARLIVSMTKASIGAGYPA
ncbi:hypothetical protein ASG84_09035 [Rhodococcus sp. Leaf278]|uniref:hypothetical protein n=1 Tax=Rhodococcus sp. Leaf278 TaxID=1736319 RepID=UPI00070B66BF|nr:hypothetical protein [Rhodococcus sp. Leaf278]KQU46648.1 hypothetical protein ASG84_09035 [Rhodococcus sp. Leaf278]